MTAEPPTVEGPLARDIVAREIRARLSAVKACYERSLRDDPSLAGRLELHWTIRPAGTTADLRIDRETLRAPAVGTCVQLLASRWRFPAPDQDVKVATEFVFSPRD